MSLLVDYSSSSEDEAPPRVVKSTPHVSAPVSLPSNELSATSEHDVEPTKTAKKKVTKVTKKKAKKPKTTLFLPPEIQKLLESGTLGDSDDDVGEGEGDSLLAKQKRVVAKRPRTVDAKSQVTASTLLSFLPVPKHHIEEPKPKPSPSTNTEPPQATAEEASSSTEELSTASAVQLSDANAYATQQQHYATQQQLDATQQPHYDQQYYYQQYYQQQQDYAPTHEHEPEQQPTSKRARHRDRELERMLQLGQFDAVADKIVEVAAPAPDSWQAPPVEELQKGTASELKVKASFWNASAGTAVASAKPSRLQRQKHQLNQLAFDAKAREFELLDRKGAAIKTKRETHAKYGW